MGESAEHILKKYWGFSSFKKGQEKVIRQIQAKKDTLALMPTGGGKSICFQVPALAQPGICLVISPLVALMQEQVKDIKERGIKAVSLSGRLSGREIDRRFDNCINGNFKFLYLSPERMMQENIQERLQHLPVNLIAVDEAHCISEWGHDFRPAYREINILTEMHPKAPVLALTATATKKTAQDICKNLDLPPENTVQQSFERKNLSLLIQKSEYKTQDLLDALDQNAPAIVYVRNRKNTVRISEFLNDRGITAGAFHGGLSQGDRAILLENWLGEKFFVMVATTAFGMGIDKENVRTIVHYQLPESLESYYQEAGRAGRDGKPGKAVLIYNNHDLQVVKNQFLSNLPTPENVKKIYRKLTNFLQIAYGEGQESSHNFSFSAFCLKNKLNFQLTYNVLSLLDRSGVLTLSREFQKQTQISFRINNRSLYSFLEAQPRFEKLVKTILRQNGGFFTYDMPVNISLLSKKTKISITKIKTLFKDLEKLEIINLHSSDQDISMTFWVPREDDRTINPLIPYIKQQHQNKHRKVQSVLDFVCSENTCKTKQLLFYFGEGKKVNCGKCSYCLSTQHKFSISKEEYRTQIKALKNSLEKKVQSSRELCQNNDIEPEKIIPILRLMLDKQLIELTENNKYKLKT